MSRVVRYSCYSRTTATANDIIVVVLLKNARGVEYTTPVPPQERRLKPDATYIFSTFNYYEHALKSGSRTNASTCKCTRTIPPAAIDRTRVEGSRDIDRVLYIHKAAY